MVVCTVNYRLNCMGFFYSNNSDAPGNVGLWDQRIALQWIQQNIKLFGGDPNSVTICGESAGSISVSYHLLSPGSRPFYKRAIMESGSSVLMRGIAHDPATSITFSSYVAKLCGCPAYPIIDMNCMRSVPVDIIVNKCKLASSTIGRSTVMYGTEFLFPSPDDAFRSNYMRNQQLMLGVNANESPILFYYGFLQYLPKQIPQIFTKKEVELLTTIVLPFLDDQLTSEEYAQVMNYYFGGIEETDVSRGYQALSSIIGDTLFTCPTLYFGGSSLIYGNNTPYFYFFNQNTSYNQYDGWDESTHGQEVQYVFGMPLLHQKLYTDRERELSRRMIGIWSSFVYNG
jgi:carboxylesterase type B